MGWYKQACSECWDNHDGLTCDEYQRQKAQWAGVSTQQRLMKEQNAILREQLVVLKSQKGKL